MRIVVYHRSYGCETGCCGHAIAVDPPVGEKPRVWDAWDAELDDSFSFSHPYTDNPGQQLEWAKKFITEKMGADHVADLDWEHCIINAD